MLVFRGGGSGKQQTTLEDEHTRLSSRVEVELIVRTLFERLSPPMLEMGGRGSSRRENPHVLSEEGADGEVDKGTKLGRQKPLNMGGFREWMGTEHETTTSG